jgi:hypothetical protein
MLQKMVTWGRGVIGGSSFQPQTVFRNVQLVCIFHLGSFILVSHVYKPEVKRIQNHTFYISGYGRETCRLTLREVENLRF